MNLNDLKEFLDEKVLLYNAPAFIVDDPIQIPHLYTLKEDIEIAGYLSATIAWGNRKMIIKNAKRMMELMGNSPYDFVMEHKQDHLDNLDSFVHRTFNGVDFATFIKGLKHIYTNHNGLESVFANTSAPMQERISNFKRLFFEIEHPTRSEKHISDPMKGSAAKRINMYLRWMVRNDNNGVDLGIWNTISTADLSCPLDVHSGNVARKLGILKRKQNDAKALAELDNVLRQMDPIDPVKYDFALFGLGAIEKF
ncbi:MULTISPECIES: TIGR02757 family protein [Myroides]|uniref:TIGR02757 family protein n=1 Tax=Myroides albus TaxID=2562892 RepID=A0A6I3LLC2_9FLAO|nr:MULTISPECIES: TIGR02757 family protein [Myroides]MTG98306.1 TIGR02757 family protein [Myroides albus]MVX36486.1 TIGR02757 family protein [Myroides sp. LoEW2-1]UVD79622.1 TIGR02757 family protein [Myroides albus]